MEGKRHFVWAALGFALALAMSYVPLAGAEFPPTVEIVTPAMGEVVSGTYLVTGTASDDVGVGNVSVRIDDGPWMLATDTSGNGTWSTWSFSWDTTAYPNGWHHVWALAEDIDDLPHEAVDAVEVQVQNHVNTLPWVTITSPEHESVVCGLVVVEGHAGDEDEGDAVELVQVRFREGEWKNATPQGPNGSWSGWTFELDTTAYDNGWGRLDARSWDGEAYSEIYDVWIRVLNPCDSPDNHRPWVHIDTPAGGSTVSGLVVISGRAGDPDDGDHVTLVQVRIGRDGTWVDAFPLGPDTDPWRTWAIEWDTTTWEDGWVLVCARSYDTHSAVSELHCIEVRIHNGEGEHENHRPVVHITHPSNGQTVSGTVIVTGTAEDPDEPFDRVERVEVRIDEGVWHTATDTSNDGSWHTWKFAWNTREWENGWHRICARSWDGSLYSELDCREIFVENHIEDNQRPHVDITHPDDGSTVHGTVVISGTAWDDHQVELVQVRIGEGGEWRNAFDTSHDGSWSTWAFEWHTGEWEDGCYRIFARSWDGTQYSEMDSILLCVDNHPDEPADNPPIVEITEPHCGAEVSGTVVIRGRAEDDHEVVRVQVSIDGGEWRDATPTGPDGGWGTWAFEWPTQEFDNGWHHVRARALDNAEQWSEIDVCEYFVHNPPEGMAPTPAAGQAMSALVPIGSILLLAMLVAAFVRRRWLGSML